MHTKFRRECLVGLFAAGAWLSCSRPVEFHENDGPRLARVDELEAQAMVPDRIGLGRVVQTSVPLLAWSSIGPQPIDDSESSSIFAGRVNSIVVDPTNASVVYLAAAQGGVWKSIDAGMTWHPISDDLSSLSSGALCIDPTEPNVLYYGTGEQNYSYDSWFGDGLFRSEDGGTSWTKIAAKSSVGSYIARVAVHGQDPTILLIASSSGLVRSTDRGATWSYPLAIAWCNDVVMDPIDNSVVYAALYGSGLYKSLDAGATWTQLTSGLPFGSGTFTRINLAISASDRTRVYASFVKPNGALLGFYRTQDSGQSWTGLVNTPNYVGAQGWYNNTVVVDPLNADVVYAGGLSATTYGVIKTTNGGATWTDVTGFTHADHHCLAFGPDATLWLGNDGGVWKSPNGASSWINCNATLAITQFGTCSQHPTDPELVVGGTQDNGTIERTSADTWLKVWGGDGGTAQFRTDVPSIYVFQPRSTPSGRLFARNRDTGTTTDVSGPWFPNEPADSDAQFLCDPNQAGKFLFGTSRVWCTTDGCVSWAPISGVLDPNGGRLRSIAAVLGFPNMFYATTTNGRVFFTSDGTSWVSRSAGLPASQAFLDVTMSPVNPQVAYLIARRSTQSRIFRTNNSGLTWTSITSNFPTNLTPFCLAIDFRASSPRMFVGTDFGLYASTTNGASWFKVGSGLPNTTIADLDLNTSTNTIVAATHGRGAFRAELDIAGPSVVVLTPNGGEQWTSGTDHSVSWVATDPAGVDSVRIDLSFDGGASYTENLCRTNQNTGVFAWTVPTLPSTNCRVRVTAIDSWGNVGVDAGDGSFAILLPTDSGLPSVDFGLFVGRNPTSAPIPIRWSVTGASAPSLRVFDARGRLMCSLPTNRRGEGWNLVEWNGLSSSGTRVSSGIYFVRLEQGSRALSRRIVLR